MSIYLGIDTSNYTTSVALYDSDTKEVMQSKKLLPVKAGEKGLRQSDAVFHHTVQLPEVLGKLDISRKCISGIGVSVRPRNVEGSYMPCFLCGEGTAQMFGQLLKIPVHRTSHQMGHILAGLYSAGKLELLQEKFIAFHVSGGTTDCVLCEPDTDLLVKVTPLSSSADLKAGQLIDRVGLMLGLPFPCGAELEKLAQKSAKNFKYRPVMKGKDCCLSGLENQCRKMLDDGAPQEDTAKFCLTAVGMVLQQMTKAVLAEFPESPVLYAGGVMADKFIRQFLENENTFFAEPQFSCDNATGTAIYASICMEGKKIWKS